MEEPCRVEVRIAVALSENGEVRCWHVDQHNVQLWEEHRKNLEKIRDDKQLWSVAYSTMSLLYPVQHEGE